MSDANRKSGGSARGAFYRVSRMLHGYLSAAAFLALLFFAGTGVLLNHPEWFPEATASRQTENISLDSATLARARALSGDEQTAVLASGVASRVHVLGAYSTGEIFDTEALLRFEGVRGNSTATVNLATGSVELELERANTVSLLNDLHRGKNAGAAWKLIIDIVGILTIALSLLGFVIFFSLRFRLLTSLTLVAAGAAAMAGVFFALVR